MPLTITGNINGPQGQHKTFGDLATGATFVYTENDVANNVFFVKTAEGAVFSPATGSTHTQLPSQSVIEAIVSAKVEI